MELKRYWKIICMRKWIFLHVISGVMGVAMICSFVLRPIYKASASVIFKAKDSKIAFLSDLPGDFGRYDYFESKNGINTYIALLKSKPFVEKVIKDLDLRSRKGELLESKELIISMLRLPILLLVQKKGVEIKQLGSSEILEVVGYSTQPDEAVKIANKTVQALSAAFYEIYRDSAIKARNDLERSVINARIKRSAAETKQLAFMTRAGLADADDQMKALVDQWTYLENEQTKSMINLEKLKTENTENHPDVQVVLSQIKAVARQIDAINISLSEMAKKQVELSQLQKDVDTYRTVYSSLLKNLEMAKIAESMNVSNVLQLHPAGLSFDISNDIYFPRKKLIFVIALFAGLTAGLFFVFLLEYLDSTIKTPDDVRNVLAQPLLGVIKQVDHKKIGDISGYAK